MQDTTKPRVTNIVFSRNGRVFSPTSIFGPVDVIAEAHQMPARKVPPPWNNLPVTPARIRWRIRRGDHTVRPWHTPIELSKTLLPRTAFRRIYAPGTRQNRQGKPGLYRFHLAHRWSTTLLQDGHYQLEVEATDLRGIQWWAGTHVAAKRRGSRRYTHRLVGEITLEWDSLTSDAEPDQQLVIYTAEPGSRSEQALRELAQPSA